MVSGAVPLTSCSGRYMPEKGGECARRRMPRAKSSVTVCVGNGAGPVPVISNLNAKVKLSNLRTMPKLAAGPVPAVPGSSFDHLRGMVKLPAGPLSAVPRLYSDFTIQTSQNRASRSRCALGTVQALFQQCQGQAFLRHGSKRKVPCGTGFRSAKVKCYLFQQCQGVAEAKP